MLDAVAVYVIPDDLARTVDDRSPGAIDAPPPKDR